MKLFTKPSSEQVVPNLSIPVVQEPSRKFDKKYILMGLGVGLIVVVGVFGAIYLKKGPQAFSSFRKSVFSPLVNRNSNDDDQKLTIQSPLTGIKYTEEESASWVNTRPLGVIINNHVDARPQAGLINADIVYEIVAEGGITRFLAFYQSDIPEKLGPIRSVREYYLVINKEIGDAMLMHHGFSPQALVAIESWPVRSLQRGNAPYWRENPRNVAIEHTLYANGKEVVKKGLELGWEGTMEDFQAWKFKDSPDKYAQSTVAEKIEYDFWYTGDFSVIWTFDKDTNSYKRFMGYDSANNPIPHIDDVTKNQLMVKNVIVQFVTENKVVGDDKNRLDYDLVGSGKALVFIDGKVVEATWSKASRDARTLFYDTNGSEIEFNRGKMWVSILPDRNVDLVKYSAAQPTAPSN